MTDTNIYRYWGGPDYPELYGDPLEIERTLKLILGDFDAFLEAYNSPDPAIALQATQKFKAAMATAFRVRAFDPLTGQGMNLETLLALWNGYFEWRKKKQSSTGASPTSAPPTASGPLDSNGVTKQSAGLPGISDVFRHVAPGSSLTP